MWRPDPTDGVTARLNLEAREAELHRSEERLRRIVLIGRL
jgi:hypothetical protein